MLKFVICGLEHSGTTLLSDVFRQVPGIYSGFEVGVLLRPSPKEFEGFDPYFTNMLSGWRLTEAELVEACHSETYDDFYAKVQELSEIIPSTTSNIFDKTPRYLSCLGDCLNRTDVPFIASFKDPRSKVFSDFKRTNKANLDFDTWYSVSDAPRRRYLKTCYDAYQNARVHSQDRVALVSLESLCLDVRATCERIFEHVGLEFNTQYLLLSSETWRGPASANSITARAPFEYKKNLTTAQQQRIIDDYAEFSDWFYD